MNKYEQNMLWSSFNVIYFLTWFLSCYFMMFYIIVIKFTKIIKLFAYFENDNYNFDVARKKMFLNVSKYQ